MVGECLHEFSLDLCGYALAPVRGHLGALSWRPRKPLAPLDYDGFHRLAMPDWVGREIASLPAPLADHVWVGVAGDPVMLPLNDAELYALASAVDDPPLRCEDECVWDPYPALHARSVECISEVREALTRQTADEEWAAASAGFAARLCGGGLSLAGGIGIVREWLGYVRRLLGVMGATAYLPAPAGTHPTPTQCVPAVKAIRGPKQARRDGGTTDRGGGPQPRPEMLSPARITKRFDVSRSTIYAACRSGVLPHYRVAARKGARGKYLLREADVVGWLESLRVDPGAITPSASAPASSGSPASPFSELNPQRLAKAWKAG